MAGTGDTGYHYRDALRLLFIITRGSKALDDPHDGWDSVLEGEKRTQAIDFWMRYPDYLADRVLDAYEVSRDEDLLDAVKDIFVTEEPDVRMVKMVRWRRGAYENLETALAMLVYRGLASSVQRLLPNGRTRYDFLTGQAARDFLDEAIDAQPGLRWYEDRTALALRVAGPRSGTKLKEDHYEDEEYAGTPLSSLIPSIKTRVEQRLQEILKDRA